MVRSDLWVGEMLTIQEGDEKVRTFFNFFYINFFSSETTLVAGVQNIIFIRSSLTHRFIAFKFNDFKIGAVWIPIHHITKEPIFMMIIKYGLVAIQTWYM